VTLLPLLLVEKFEQCHPAGFTWPVSGLVSRKGFGGWSGKKISK